MYCYGQAVAVGLCAGTLFVTLLHLLRCCSMLLGAFQACLDHMCEEEHLCARICCSQLPAAVGQQQYGPALTWEAPKEANA
jgi:hypothetical protein